MTELHNYIFRFRSAEKLDEYKELEKQQIYFASSEQLNDPIEGDINVYFEGDKIVWENLFRNYVLNLLVFVLTSKNQVGCGLCLMSEIGANGPEANKLYLVIENDKIKYRTNLTAGNDSVELKEDISQQSEELYQAIQANNLTELSESCRNKLLDMTSRRGHTHRENEIKITTITSSISLPDNFIKIFEQIYLLFLKNKKIELYADLLSKKKYKIKKFTLLYYLESIHIYALKCIFDHLKIVSSEENHLLNEKSSKDVLEEKEFIQLSQVEENFFYDGQAIEDYYRKEALKNTQSCMLTYLLNDDLVNNHSKKIMFVDFPSEYINQINKFMYPDWFAACFSSGYKNPSLWSYYADDHNGVCLIFKASKNSEEEECISLNTLVGGNGSQHHYDKVYQNIQHKLYDVNYKNKEAHEVNFFMSLGNISVIGAGKDWYSDRKGNVSSLVKNVDWNAAEFRKNYWDNYLNFLSSKLKGWQHEEEKRVVLPSNSFVHPDDRKLTYDFKELAGIIFGFVGDKIDIRI